MTNLRQKSALPLLLALLLTSGFAVVAEDSPDSSHANSSHTNNSHAKELDIPVDVNTDDSQPGDPVAGPDTGDNPETGINASLETAPEAQAGPEHNTEAVPDTSAALSTPDQDTVDQDKADQIEETQELLLSYRAAIQSLDDNGPYHEPSYEALYGLGVSLKRQGLYQEALNTLERAMHVNRVNHGLNSLSQTPILRTIIDTQKALYRFEDVTTDYDRLLRLFQKNYGSQDPALIPVFRELALWHVDVYQMDNSDSRVDHLSSAQYLINMAIQNSQYSSEMSTQDQIDLLRTITLINFFTSQHKDDEWVTVTDSRYSASSDKDFLVPTHMASLSKSSYRRGRIANERIIALVEADPLTTAHQKIGAYVEMGDWHLLFRHRDTAMEYYDRALAMISQTDRAQEFKAHWFAQPKFLPVVRTGKALGESGAQYVSAQLDISSTGSPSHINIIEPAPETNLRLRRAALKTFKNARFRPRFVDDQAVASPGALIKIPLIH